MFWKVFAHSDLPLSEGELRVRRRQQRRVLLIAGALITLLVAGCLSVRPVLGVVHGWQSRRHAQKAFAFITQENWGPARDEAIAAYQLRPTEPQAIRAVARLFSHAGKPDGLNFWKQLRNRSTLSRADLRDEAGLALRSKDSERADQAVAQLLSTADGGPTPGDWLLAADLAMQEQDLDAALSHVRRVLASTNVAERDQYQATVDLDKLLTLKEAPDRTEVVRRLAGLARSRERTGLDALVALGQRAQGSGENASGISVDEIIQLLEAHPLGKTAHKLLAVGLRIHQHPAQKEELTQKAINRWKQGDHEALIALASWLNSRGEYQRELDTISRQRAIQNRDLFFEHVTALDALKRWDEIHRLIESEQFPLDPVVEHMYLARCSAQQGQSAAAENNWGRSLGAAAGDLGKLLTLAEYAEKNGAYAVAGQAYEAAASVSPKSRLALQGRLRIAYVNHDTRKILEILDEAIKMWPNDPAVQSDDAYARLLLMPKDTVPDEDAEIGRIQQLAETLVARNPNSLPPRTLLALALLKQNRVREARAAYKNLNIPRNALTTSALAVHAAVLAADGKTEQARAEFSQLPAEKLLPEERLMDPDNKK